MTAESESEFDKASLEVGLKLWPGTISLYDAENVKTDLACVVTVGPVSIQLSDAEGGGLVSVRALSAEIPKTLLAAEPSSGWIVKYTIAGKPETFKIDAVDGQNDNDASWFIRAIEGGK